MTTSEKVSEILLKEKAVFLRPEEPFTWASGIQSPIYCDNRLLLSSVISREFIVTSFVDLIKPLNVDVIAGTATAGIPWASWIAYELKLPLLYVRSTSKGHGRQNAVEGKVLPGQKSVLIEDLISTGMSSINAAKKLEEEGVKVLNILSIFNYDFPQTKEIFRQQGLETASLSTFEILANVAYNQRMLNNETLTKVLEWRKSVQFP